MPPILSGMSISEWTELSEVADRLDSLKTQGKAAAAAGNFATAAYFFHLAKLAANDRERLLERLIGNEACGPA
jgi:hypothetical protein